MRARNPLWRLSRGVEFAFSKSVRANDLILPPQISENHLFMARYCVNFRRKVLAEFDSGERIIDIAEKFRICASNISRGIRLRKDTGDVVDKKRVMCDRKINLDELQKLVKEHPDMYQEEMAERFNASQPAICAALKEIGVSRKKKLYFIPSVMKKNATNFAKK